jgi:alpha-beta hydrolase superfamily lysophospholipase
VSFREQLGERIGIVEPSDRAPSAQIVLVHGLSDHLGRQLRFARWLAGEGYRAVGFDLLGHGGQASAWADSFWVYEAYAATQSAHDTIRRLERERPRARDGARGLAARQYETLRRASAEDHVAQLARAVEVTRQLDPSLPIVLIGHSMGALLIIEALCRWSQRPEANVRGVVLLSPALKPQARPGNPLERLLVEAVWGLRRAPFSATRAAFKAALDLNLPVDTTWGNPWISDLAEEIALFGSDPLIPRRLPTRYASTIESLMATRERRGFDAPVPGLVLLPEKDGITSVSAGLRFARSVRNAAGRDRFSVVQFGGLCAHDLLRSSARERALSAISGWLEGLLRPQEHRAAG